MAREIELDVQVEQAVASLRGKGEKVTSHSVKRLVKHRAEDVLRAYQRYMNKQRAKREAELSLAISPGVAAELIKDRETYSEDKTQLIKEEAEQLQADCEVLNDEVVELREELAEVQELSKKDREVLTEKIDAIQELNTELDGQINSQRGEIKSLKEDRETARNERSDYKDKFSGIKRTLNSKASEERRARTRSKNLAAQLKETVQENQLLQEVNNELNKNLKASHDQVELEHKERKEAETRIEKLMAEIKKLQKKKTSTENK
jgi:chromosome segregation ATPase